jgi:sigma-E factor negative regulatory protein RseB
MQTGPVQTSATDVSVLSGVLRAAGGSAALCLAAQVWAASAAIQDDPRDWLARTDEALSNRNYEGVFVHEHAGESETLRVIHRVDGEGVSERLLSMDGSGREFIRKGAQLICYLPDQHMVLVEKTPDAALLLTGLPRIDAGSAGQYGITELARTRVSGRDARVIAIAPTDQLRYGYRVWIDEGTAMPLKTQLRDSHGGVLEQIIFTSLHMVAHIPKAELEPGVDARGYRWVRRESEPVDSSALTVSWEANTLPAGFHMTASARQMLPSGPVEHLVFSDGLASVSVFVEMDRAAASAAHDDDAATLGTSSAYSTVAEGYRVTAVGEVPPETVRVIARAIHNAAPDAGAESVAGTASATTADPHGFSPTAISSGPAAAAGPVRGLGAGAETPGFGAAAAPIFGPPSRPPAGGPGRR